MNKDKYTEHERGYSQTQRLFPTTRTLRRKDFTGRNSPCPCGSGKKYKKCCLDKPVQTESEKRPGWRA